MGGPASGNERRRRKAALCQARSTPCVAATLAEYSAVQLTGAHHRATPFSQVDGHTVYPSVKVKDAVAEGAAKVKVVLKSVEMCEEDGSAEQTTWAALAFNFSDNGRKR